MLRAQALQIIAQHERELRDLAGPGSDADVLVEFDRPVGYFHLFDVQEQLEAFLGCKVAWSRPAAFGRSCTRASSPRRSVPLRDWRLRVSDILAAAAR